MSDRRIDRRRITTNNSGVKPIPFKLSENTFVPFPDDVTPDLVKKNMAALKARSIAISQELLHYRSYEAVDIIQHSVDPDLLTGLPVDFDTLIEFIVPESLVFQLSHLGVSYSDPLVAKCLGAVGWRVCLNDRRVVNVTNPDGQYFYASIGDVQRPMALEHMFFQSGDKVSIQLHTEVGFNNHITMTGRLSGRLYKPANSRVL